MIVHTVMLQLLQTTAGLLLRATLHYGNHVGLTLTHCETALQELTAARLAAIFKTNGNKLRMTCRVMLPYKSKVALKFHIQSLID